MKNRETIKYSIALFLVALTINAQETFPDDVNDVPIDNWVIPIAALGVVLMYLYIRMKRQSSI